MTRIPISERLENLRYWWIDATAEYAEEGWLRTIKRKLLRPLCRFGWHEYRYWDQTGVMSLEPEWGTECPRCGRSWQC